MTAQILNGKQIAHKRRAEIAKLVAQRRAHSRRAPGLAVILVGQDPASEVYVRHKQNDCREVGFESVLRRLPASTTQECLEAEISAFNARDDIDGVLVQLPLPPQLDAQHLLERVDPRKDVDGFHPYNLGRLAVRQPALRPCTSLGVMTLLAATQIPLRGLNTTILGASNHVGRPMGLELLLAGCTVTTVHKFSRNLEADVRRADLLVSAVGRPGLVQGEWIKPGAIVVDVGLTRTETGKLCGDVDFEPARLRASWITPVPGGVGPMTRLGLLENTLSICLASDSTS